MNPNKLTFQSEDLEVDFIAFNIKGLTDHFQIKKIGETFSPRLNYNSKILAYHQNDLIENLRKTIIQINTEIDDFEKKIQDLFLGKK